MLSRIRIEVSDEETAAACEEGLDAYEGSIQRLEAKRFGFAVQYVDGGDWHDSETTDYGDKLGREVTDEVLEYDPSIPGYKGRRVVQFRRLDTRSSHIADPEHSECLGGGRFCVTESHAKAA